MLNILDLLVVAKEYVGHLQKKLDEPAMLVFIMH